MRVSLISPGRHHDGSPRTELNFKCQKHKKSIFTNYLSIKEKIYNMEIFISIIKSVVIWALFQPGIHTPLGSRTGRCQNGLPAHRQLVQYFEIFIDPGAFRFMNFLGSRTDQLWSVDSWLQQYSNIKYRTFLRFLEIFSCFAANFSVF